MTFAEQIANTERPAPLTMPAPPPVKSCRCGRDYDADEWERLAFVGVMEDDVDSLELRNCDCCESTIAIVRRQQ